MTPMTVVPPPALMDELPHGGLPATPGAMTSPASSAHSAQVFASLLAPGLMHAGDEESSDED
jgi:hypothetical protein